MAGDSKPQYRIMVQGCPAANFKYFLANSKPDNPYMIHNISWWIKKDSELKRYMFNLVEEERIFQNLEEMIDYEILFKISSKHYK